MTLYTIYDLATGEVIRSGGAEAQHLPNPTRQHGVLLGVRANPNTQKIDTATSQPVARPQSKRDAWRSSLPDQEPDDRDVVIAAMAAKLTPAELTAARARLKSEK